MSIFQLVGQVFPFSSKLYTTEKNRLLIKHFFDKCGWNKLYTFWVEEKCNISQ